MSHTSKNQKKQNILDSSTTPLPLLLHIHVQEDSKSRIMKGDINNNDKCWKEVCAVRNVACEAEEEQGEVDL